MRYPIAVCCFLLSMACATAEARTIYVDNVNGDDRFTGAEPETTVEGNLGPVRTIGRAVELAISGDKIHLADSGEPYREAISLFGRNNSGNGDHFFTIEGNGATLDGSMPLPPAVWEHYRGSVFRARPRHVSHQQLFLDGRPIERVDASPADKDPPEIGELQWCLHGGFIYFRVERRNLPEDYNLSSAGWRTGVTLLHVDRVRIADLTIQGFQLDAVSAFNTAENVVLDGLILRGCGRAGLSVGGCSDVTLNACLIGDNAETQLITQPLSRTWIHNCEILYEDGQGRENLGGELWVNGRMAELP